MTEATSFDRSTVVIPAPSVYARAFGDEVVLLEFGKGEYFGVDAIGAEIWRRIEKGETLGAIADAIVASYDVSVEDALRDVLDLVREMSARSLVVVRA